jgi:hypothetical protein
VVFRLSTLWQRAGFSTSDSSVFFFVPYSPKILVLPRERFECWLIWHRNIIGKSQVSLSQWCLKRINCVQSIALGSGGVLKQVQDSGMVQVAEQAWGPQFIPQYPH